MVGSIGPVCKSPEKSTIRLAFYSGAFTAHDSSRHALCERGGREKRREIRRDPGMALSVVQFELESVHDDILNGADVTIDLYVGGSRIPFAFHGRCVLHLGKFSCHVLALWYLSHCFVIHEDVDSCSVDVQSPNDLRGLDIALSGNCVG